MAKRLLIFFSMLFCVVAATDLDKMPPDGIPPGWVRKGDMRQFTGSSLFRHINGGAELYLQHGFEMLLVQDYHQGETEVRVEIYKMKEASGASAVFDEISAGMNKEKTYGSVSVLDEYQTMFVRGAFCVSVTRFEKSTESKAALEALTTDIDHRLN